MLVHRCLFGDLRQLLTEPLRPLCIGRPVMPTKFEVTQWHTAPALMGPPSIDFYIDAGTVTVSPASASAACVELLLVAEDTTPHSLAHQAS